MIQYKNWQSTQFWNSLWKKVRPPTKSSIIIIHLIPTKYIPITHRVHHQGFLSFIFSGHRITLFFFGHVWIIIMFLNLYPEQNEKWLYNDHHDECKKKIRNLFTISKLVFWFLMREKFCWIFSFEIFLCDITQSINLKLVNFCFCFSFSQSFFFDYYYQR